MPKKKRGGKDSASTLPPHPQDLFALSLLFEQSGGAQGLWLRSDHWLDPAVPLAEWYGVKVNEATGRVTELWLRANGLRRGVPEALGLLPELRFADLEANALGGPAAPASLGNLRHLAGLWLEDCQLSSIPAGWGNQEGTGLRVNSREELQALLKAAADGLGGSAAGELRDRASLASLFFAWGGPGWLNRSGWGSSQPLGQWHGVTTDRKSGRVVALYLGQNGLQGPMDPTAAGAAAGVAPGDACGLGALARLNKLSLYGNFLSGRVDPGIARLTALR